MTTAPQRARTTGWRRPALIAACAGMALLAGGCEGVREELGLTKRAPDEFTVVTKAPLVMPPDFQLRPPRPGASRPNELDPSQRARTALSGSERTASTQPMVGTPRDVEMRGPGGNLLPTESLQRTADDGRPQSASEQTLAHLAGADRAAPDIRRLVDRETANLEEADKSFTDRLVFWQKAAPPGTVIDPRREAQRLQDNAATGRAPTEGDTPVIVRRKRGILEGIF